MRGKRALLVTASVTSGGNTNGNHVRFGSLADICSAKGHVRFTPESGHVWRTRSCPLSAKSGHSVDAELGGPSRVPLCMEIPTKGP